VPAEGLLSEPQLLWNLNLSKINVKELQSFSDRRFFTVDGDEEMHAVCVWFVCTFPTPLENEYDEG
jgi:hypothetical protein